MTPLSFCESTMTTLPSFVELMGSLGLDLITPDQGTSSPAISPRRPGRPQHVKSKSTQCFREANIFRDRQRVVRYSPYSPALVSDFPSYLAELALSD
jgi:hypothetical protein